MLAQVIQTAVDLSTLVTREGLRRTLVLGAVCIALSQMAIKRPLFREYFVTGHTFDEIRFDALFLGRRFSRLGFQCGAPGGIGAFWAMGPASVCWPFFFFLFGNGRQRLSPSSREGEFVKRLELRRWWWTTRRSGPF